MTEGEWLACNYTGGTTLASKEDELWGAMFLNDTASVKRLLGEGVAVNKPNMSGSLLLIEAARYGKSEYVGVLLRAGADMAAHDSYWNDSALIVASREGHPDAVRLLIDAGADVNYTNSHFSSALQEAVKSDSAKHLEVARMLITARADVNAGRAVTVLMEASRNSNPEAIKSLIAAGANVNAATNQGTALIQAVRKNRAENVAALLELGADPNARVTIDSAFKDMAGKTALELAIALKRHEIASLLRSLLP